jgi:hypothetical protein
MALYRVGPLPDAALAASARFHDEELSKIEALLNPLRSGENLVILFPPADHTHRGWRLAVVQQLAREHAPIRINALESDAETAIAAALSYLETAEGVTGQLLPLAGTGAGRILSRAQ